MFGRKKETVKGLVTGLLDAVLTATNAHNAAMRRTVTAIQAGDLAEVTPAEKAQLAKLWRVSVAMRAVRVAAAHELTNPSPSTEEQFRKALAVAIEEAYVSARQA